MGKHSKDKDKEEVPELDNLKNSNIPAGISREKWFKYYFDDGYALDDY
jgi:hypothetical protein